ncbi:MAG: DUF3090 domain-containing protein [Anaerolineales bacterium]|nr:DUF3090 domain-containing protein [Anaerolineales bacterium]
MPGQVYELNPASHITTGAVGQPGQRVFYLQALQGAETVTLIVEKLQVEALAQSILQMVEELYEKFPDLARVEADYRAERMTLKKPIDPAFRVGQLGLGYDADRDLIVLVAQEVTTEQRGPEEAGVARLFATRTQMLALAEHGRAIVRQGRPICGLCGQPMDPAGHFCPRSNGHKH